MGKVEKADLEQPAETTLSGCVNPGEIAQREGWDANAWALAAAKQIRGMKPLDAQRERLAALVATGQQADQATAETLGQHFILLEALFQRLTADAAKSAEEGGGRSAARVEIFLRGALKAQRASLACLSALKALRDQPSPTTPKPQTRRRSGPANRFPTTPEMLGGEAQADYLSDTVGSD